MGIILSMYAAVLALALWQENESVKDFEGAKGRG